MTGHAATLVGSVDDFVGGLEHPEPAGFTFLRQLLTQVVDAKASDLHLTVGRPPMVRIHGDLTPLDVTGDISEIANGPLAPADTEAILRDLFTDEEWEDFQEVLERDRSFEVQGVARFRVNIFLQQGSLGAVFRVIPSVVPSLEQLGAPGALGDMARLARGLVLVTGPTGSGKSTTLAAILDQANATRPAHIMTIEDPIEFVHKHKMAIINQREVGTDTRSFAAALKHALRQDPDIILVGELRDLETTQVAISAAETGHLVLATLHTKGAAATIDRLIDIFPAGQQSQIRTQLATTLQAVVSQSLLPNKNGNGRQLVAEVMLATPAIRSLIREGKTFQIPSAMHSASDVGMTTFDRELASLVSRDLIEYRVAYDAAQDPIEFARLAGRS
ncbi:MAG: pilT [Glaciihabitans sp.]|nr:pilT [Glaciihabitans sp.]